MPKYPTDPLTGKRRAAVPPTTIPKRILEALEFVGDMTTTELGEHLNVGRAAVAHHIRLLRKGGFGPFIRGWQMQDGRGMPSPVYGVMSQTKPHKDVPRPVQTRAEQKRKYYWKNRAVILLQRHGVRSEVSRYNNPFGLTPEMLRDAPPLSAVVCTPL